MDNKVFKILEFNKILESLSSRAVTAMGKEYAAGLVPSTEINEIVAAQKETSEAVSSILKKGSLPLGGVRDIRQSLKRAEIGGTLSIEELLHVSDFLRVCGKIIRYGKPEDKRESFAVLEPLFKAVVTVSQLEKNINACIKNEKELYDDASRDLKEIRRNIKTSNEKIKDQLNSIIRSQSYKNMLQDNVITIRGGRYCVPVKSEYRTSFAGMIHDQSSTGATLFIEPMSVVQINNRIRELTLKEEAEIEKILRMLSDDVLENIVILNTNQEIIARLDFIFAKAELSVSYFGTEPVFNENGYINIKKARHPLLSRDTAVPIDIWLGREFTTLLITGPNTGGKTVSLKTCGLFTLMGQAGLHIPALDNSELAVFGDVFADIGDEQSIEQNLSTFSGHMKNIVAILENVTPDSLVLLDELCAGTDPVEGAAIASAIIQYLYAQKIRTVVTTHYSELKVLALSTQGMANAACEFDTETLRPTYKLLIGIPGKSNAFAISQRLGLPNHIIEMGRAALSGKDERFEDIITDLETSRKTVIMERERAQQYRRDAEALKRDYEKQKERQMLQREKFLAEAKNDSRLILERAKQEASEIIKEMQKIASSQKLNFKELEVKRQQINEKIDEIEISTETTKPSRKTVDKPLSKGDSIYIHSLNQYGTVVEPADYSGDFMAQIGVMKIEVNISDVSLYEPDVKSITRKKPTGVSYSSNIKKDKALNVSSELDLRGHSVDEALERIDKYLDDASLTGLQQVGIIHGKGTGVLRAAIHEYMRRHPHVKSYRLGNYGEGDTGITLVDLK